MQRLSTTVVALVGPDPSGTGTSTEALVESVGAAANVRGVVPDDAPPLDRAVRAWTEARRSRRTYVLHDADPLAAVVDAWVERYDAAGPPGRLETSVADVLARWRAQSLELPDFYLVVGAADFPRTRRHWYLGFLRAHAPQRVVLVDPSAEAVRGQLPRLPAGRWWPELPRLLDGVDRVVPDSVGVGETGGERSAGEGPRSLIVGGSRAGS